MKVKTSKPRIIRKKAPKKILEKPYNENSMTSSAFFGMIRAVLRRKTMFGWKPINKVREEAKVVYKGPNKRQKFAYICNKCHGKFSAKECAVHHKIPVGKLSCFEDLPLFVKNLFCEKQNLELLCSNCHILEHEKLSLVK